MFAFKAIMKESSYKVLIVSLLISLPMLSYTLRLFEQKVQTTSFNNLTTSAWCVLITMTTVGYGDIYPESHMGRLVGVVCSFWGVCFVSLFVVALTNITNFDFSEKKAFMLLQRLQAKEVLRE